MTCLLPQEVVTTFLAVKLVGKQPRGSDSSFFFLPSEQCSQINTSRLQHGTRKGSATCHSSVDYKYTTDKLSSVIGLRWPSSQSAQEMKKAEWQHHCQQSRCESTEAGLVKLSVSFSLDYEKNKCMNLQHFRWFSNAQRMIPVLLQLLVSHFLKSTFFT